MQTTPTPDATRYLVYNDALMSTQEGLWLCTTAEDAAVVGVNAAALSITTTYDMLPQAREFFEAFPYVLVIGPDEGKRNSLVNALRKYVPSIEVWTSASQSVYCGCQTLDELRARKGFEYLENQLPMEVVEIPPHGLLEVSSIDDVDLSRLPHARSGIPNLDKLIGGLYEGELSIWTGKRKEGKSTMIGIPILTAIKEGRAVFVYSGELPAWRYKAWLTAMAAGPDYVDPSTTETGKQVWTPRPEIRAQIDMWWKDKLYIADNKVSEMHNPEVLLAMMRYANKRYKCSIFVIDNLMTVSLPGEDKYNAQSAFVGQLVDFAHETSSHVHLVAHRRKGGNEKKRGDSDDVSGSSEITNRADNLFGVSRIEEEDSEFNARLEIILNRSYGETGYIDMKFDPRSRRFYLQNPNWNCGWERKGKVLQGQQQFTVITGKADDNPFL
jgi:twinkle protein